MGKLSEVELDHEMYKQLIRSCATTLPHQLPVIISVILGEFGLQTTISFINKIEQDPRLQGRAPGFRQGQNRDKIGLR